MSSFGTGDHPKRACATQRRDESACSDALRKACDTQCMQDRSVPSIGIWARVSYMTASAAHTHADSSVASAKQHACTVQKGILGGRWGGRSDLIFQKSSKKSHMKLNDSVNIILCYTEVLFALRRKNLRRNEIKKCRVRL